MRRLLALVLTLATCAFAPVQPLAWARAERHCCCCDGDGSCGMPDCLPPPVSARTAPVASEPVRLAVAAVRRVAQPAPAAAERFFASFVAPSAAPAAVRASCGMTPTARVPRFVAHCSFLI